MLARFLALALALIAPITLGVACKGGGGSSVGEFITILVTSPPDGAQTVNVATRIGFQVSDEAVIDEMTLNGQTFFLTDEDGNVVTGTYSVGGDEDDGPDVAVMELDEPLDVITNYTATITTGLVASGASLEEDYTWEFRTLDSEWGESEWLESTSTGTSNRQDAVVDAQLNAFAIWEYEQQSGTSIWANVYTRTGLWGTPQPVDSELPNASRPRIAADGLGNAFAVWQRLGPGGVPTDRVWVNRYDAEDGWGTAEFLQTEETAPARAPSVAAYSDGSALAVWVETDLDTQEEIVTASRYEPGSGWGPSERIEGAPDSSLTGLTTRVRMDGDGNAIALWSRPTVGGTVLWSNRYTAGSGWGTAELVKSDPDTDANAQRMSVGANGDAVVVWVQNEGDRDDIWAARYSNGSWGAPERIDTYDLDDKDAPAIAVDGNGVAHAVWSQIEIELLPGRDPRPLSNIWANRYTPGSGWGNPQLIEQPIVDEMGNPDPDEDGDATRPRIATNVAGNTFVVWVQVWEDWASVWSNRLDPGQDWMEAERIENIPRSAKAPIILVDNDRHAHAVWLHSIRSGVDWVRTNRFE